MSRFCSFLALFIASFAWSGSYSYHPSTTLYLGAGFDPLHPERAYRDCISYNDRKNVDGSGAMTTRYVLSLAKSRKEVFQQLNISASLSARSLFWGAGASGSYLSELEMHSDSLTWMVMGKSEYGRHVMRDAKLTPEAQALISSKQHDKFAQMCGFEYVQQERRAAMVAAIFSIQNVSDQQRQKLEAQFQGALSSGAFRVEAKAKYGQFFTAASQVSQVHVSIYAVGGEGITQLANLITHPDDLSAVQEVIAQYMKNLDEYHAVPVEYLSGSMAVFGYEGQSSMDTYKMDRVLGEIYHRYEDAYSVYKRLESILDTRGSGVYDYLTDAQVDQYRKWYGQYSHYLQELISAADACHDDIKSCVFPELSPERVKWPIQTASRCEEERLKAFWLKLIDQSEMERMRRFKVAPVFRDVKNGIEAEVFCFEDTQRGI